MEGGETEVSGAAAGPCAGAMMEVWPRPELAGSAGQGHGFMGRWLAMASRRGADHGLRGARLTRACSCRGWVPGSRGALAACILTRRRSAKE